MSRLKSLLVTCNIQCGKIWMNLYGVMQRLHEVWKPGSLPGKLVARRENKFILLEELIVRA